MNEVVICKRDQDGKCTHELYPGIHHIEIFTPGMKDCSIYGIGDTSLIRRAAEWFPKDSCE